MDRRPRARAKLVCRAKLVSWLACVMLVAACGLTTPTAAVVVRDGRSTPSPGPSRAVKVDGASLEVDELHEVFNSLKVPTQPCAVVDDLRSDESFRATVEGYLGCAQDSWREVLIEIDIPVPAPDLMFEPDTECQKEAFDNPGFYCPADDTIAIDPTQRTELAQFSDLTLADLVFHEYAHAVQDHLGFDQGAEGQDLRRLELQASCWSAVQVSRLVGLSSDAAAKEALVSETLYGDSKTHGSEYARVRWIHWGLNATTYRDCDTWSAPDDQIDG